MIVQAVVSKLCGTRLATYTVTVHTLVLGLPLKTACHCQQYYQLLEGLLAYIVLIYS